MMPNHVGGGPPMSMNGPMMGMPGSNPGPMMSGPGPQMRSSPQMHGGQQMQGGPQMPMHGQHMGMQRGSPQSMMNIPNHMHGPMAGPGGDPMMHGPVQMGGGPGPAMPMSQGSGMPGQLMSGPGNGTPMSMSGPVGGMNGPPMSMSGPGGGGQGPMQMMTGPGPMPGGHMTGPQMSRPGSGPPMGQNLNISRGPGGNLMHPGGPNPHAMGKVYPPNQPMVFNQSNPNAPPIYPCGICHKEVHENDQAILCESGCNFWFHRMCTGLSEAAFHMLTQEVYAEWVCDKCLTIKKIPLIKLKP